MNDLQSEKLNQQEVKKDFRVYVNYGIAKLTKYNVMKHN